MTVLIHNLLHLITGTSRGKIVFVFFCFFGTCLQVIGQQNAGRQLSLRDLDSLASTNNPAGNARDSKIIFGKGRSFARSDKASALSRTGAVINLNSCYDTSGRLVLGTQSGSYYTGRSTQSADGNIFIPGQFYDYNNGNPIDKGFLIKADKYGNVLWAKLYDSLPNKLVSNYLNYYRILELQDGSLLLIGSTQDKASENDDFIITKTDAVGNVIWTKDYYSRLWTHGGGSASYFYVHQMQQDPASGDVYMNGPTWSQGIVVLRLDVASGNIIWSNAYLLNSNGYNYDRNAGIVVKPNEIIAIACYANYSADLLIYRINKATGDTISTKDVRLMDTVFNKVALLSPEPLQVFPNGDIVLAGKQYGYYQYQFNGSQPLYQAGVLVLDSNLNFRNGFSFKNYIESNSYNTRVTVNKDGSGLFTMLQYNSGYSGNLLTLQFQNNIILKERMKNYTNAGFPSENLSLPLGAGADMRVNLVGDSINNTSRVEFTKLHVSDTSSGCLGIITANTFTVPFHYGSQGNVFMDSLKRSLFSVRRVKSFGAAPLIIGPPTNICSQVSKCDSLKLSTALTTVCAGNSVNISMFRNVGCRTPVLFTYDTSKISSFISINDSTYRVQFNVPWQGYIYGNLAGCTDLRDSLLFTVLQAPASLNLGPDSTICPQNTIILNAHTGYASYDWQDASHDSTFIVTQPGIYFVNTIDGCGNHFTDTIQILPHAPIPLNIGNDITICKYDSAVLTAPSGFLNYTWTPQYNLSAISANAVRVFPYIDTAYTVKAEKTPGCFAFDTIKIFVHQSPAINLGIDTSFCNGGAVTLHAGSGFINYIWNTGAISPDIIATTTGYFSVTATDFQGCNSKDTIRVIDVFPTPIVNLGMDTVLCNGKTKTLTAGTFATYLWSTGSTDPQIAVSDTGFYSLTVKDLHGCTGSGSIRISKKVFPPVAFLPGDTSICNLSEMILSPLQTFTSYLWSNGETSPSVKITAAGFYGLTVTDPYGCIGSDTIIVSPKQCMFGIYVPSAFSPDRNGKNDIFKPTVFGNLTSFKFDIYNRYGQRIFATTDPSRGWDGMVKGLPQNSGTFIWICSYSFAGKSIEQRTGTMLLIR